VPVKLEAVICAMILLNWKTLVLENRSKNAIHHSKVHGGWSTTT
jgi:hypothetical protein